MAKATKMGRKPKAPEGLGKVLFVRATPEMLEALDAWARALTDERGGTVTRSDVAREVLHKALRDRAKR